jgi:hypothetical protein
MKNPARPSRENGVWLSMFIIPRTVNDEKEKMVDAPGYFGFKWNTFLSKECGE